MNVPVLRFSEFSGEWERKKVSEILQPISDNVEVEENTLYSQIGIRSHGKGIFYKEAISGKELGNKRVFWIKENAFIVNIVFAWEQAIAKTTKNEIGMIASHRFPMYQPLNNLCSVDYILCFFLTKQGKLLLELASPGGAGRNKTLGQGEFKKLKLTIPSLKEQQKIAEFLTAVDTKIQQLTKKKQLLERYKKGVMQQIFSQELRFKDEDGQAFPEWEEKNLDDVSDVRDGTHESPKYHQNGFAFITSKNLLANGSIDFENVSLISELDFNNFNKRSKVDIGDILFGMIGTIGNPVLIKTAGFAIKNVALIKEKQELKNIFLVHYLNSGVILKQFDNVTVGNTQKFIALGKIRKLKIYIPSLPEQTKIANFLTALDTKIALVESQLNGTKQYKKGLLQQLFV